MSFFFFFFKIDADDDDNDADDGGDADEIDANDDDDDDGELSIHPSTYQSINQSYRYSIHTLQVAKSKTFLVCIFCFV